MIGDATKLRGMDPKRNRCAWLLTSKIRRRMKPNCVYFGALSAPQSQVTRFQFLGWAAAIKKIGTSQERMAFMKRNLCIGAAFLALIAALGFGSPRAACQQKKRLEVYFVDVEGGQSTLCFAQRTISFLVDTGWAGARDCGWIVSVAKVAGSADRLSGADPLSWGSCRWRGRFRRADSMVNFVDHGLPAEEALSVPQNYAAYLTVRGEGQHILVKPGDEFSQGSMCRLFRPLPETISQPLAGAGAANPFVAALWPKTRSRTCSSVARTSNLWGW